MPETDSKSEFTTNLISKGLLTDDQLQYALDEQQRTGKLLAEVLVTQGIVSQDDINRALGVQVGAQVINLGSYIIEPKVIDCVPVDIVRKHKVIPVFKMDNTLTLAIADPTNIFVLDDLRRRTGFEITPVVAPEIEIIRAIDQYYGISGTIEKIIKDLDEKKLLAGEMEDTPTIKIANLLIIDALKDRASDIHIEPAENRVDIRFRIDGILHRVHSLPKVLHLPLASRIKVLANLDIAEKRMPQDGRSEVHLGNKDIDLRISTQPTVFGENVVIRLLDRSSISISMEDLGFAENILEIFDDVISKSHGIILVTGPTGSGKTTTLYAALNKLNNESVNIMTIEDPVEYHLPRVRQTQINPKAGLTYERGLRAILRQDPDIIMIGEIRDVETAEIAVQSALTGHLVFSTLHTNDAPSAFTRLINIGIEPFLISSSVIAVLAQRLVRTICPNCKEEYKVDLELLKKLGLHRKADNEVILYRGRGCANCKKTGYKGRIGLYELLCNSESISELVMKNTSSDVIRMKAESEGMKVLRVCGIQKMFDGITTIEEVMRVTL